MAQDPPRSLGQPAHVASGQAIADARGFAVARAGDRALVVYISGADGRGSLRVAALRAMPDGRGLERLGPDRNVAPSAVAVSVAWDGNSGALAYIVQRPHRGEEGPRRRRQPPPAPGSEYRSPALSDPLGATALSAGDVMFQRLDANGAPVGRPVLVFQENSRAFRVALVPDGEGWLLAWTGAISSDDEVLGTVRTMRLDANGTPRAAASDTGFTGEVGDALHIVPRGGGRAAPLVLWSGERCRAREGEPPRAPMESDPSAAVDIRPRTLAPQAPPHEHSGPPIECTALEIFAAEARADGTTGPIIEGPEIASDALALVREANGHASLLGALGTSLANASLAALPLGADLRNTRVIVAASARVQNASDTGNADGAPSAAEVVRAPAALDATSDGTTLTFVAVSPTRARVIYGTMPAGAGAPTLLQIAPAPRIFAVSVAGSQGRAPWLFFHTGSVLGGPLVFIDGARVSSHAAGPETIWQGDEQLRAHLLRAGAARAEFNRTMAVYGPVSERTPDSPNLPSLLTALRARRTRWEAACGPLVERARWLSRHGVSNDVVELAREICEIPPEAANTPAPPAAGTAP